MHATDLTLRPYGTQVSGYIVFYKHASLRDAQSVPRRPVRIPMYLSSLGYTLPTAYCLLPTTAYYPPAIAPNTITGSFPDKTSSGSGVSGDS